MSRDFECGDARRRACKGCPIEHCPAESEGQPSALQGWRLALASMGLFLGPVVLAILGAACFGESPAARLLGGVCGLIAGMAAAAFAAKRLAGSKREAPRL